MKQDRIAQYKLIREDLFLYLLEAERKEEKDADKEIAKRIEDTINEILASPHTQKIYKFLKTKNFEKGVIIPIKSYLQRINVGNITSLVDIVRRASKLGILGKIGLFFLIISSFIVRALEGFVEIYEKVSRSLEAQNEEGVKEDLLKTFSINYLSENLLNKIAKAFSFIRLFFKIRNKSKVLGNYLAISLFKRPFTTMFMLVTLLFLQIFSFKMATIALKKSASKNESGDELIKKLDYMENKYFTDKDDLPRNKLLIAIKNILKILPSTLLTSVGLTFTKIRNFFAKKFEDEILVNKEDASLKEEIILKEFLGANILKLGSFTSLIITGLKFIMDFIKNHLKVNNQSFEAIHRFINTYFNRTSKKLQQFLVKLKILDRKFLEKTQA